MRGQQCVAVRSALLSGCRMLEPAHECSVKWGKRFGGLFRQNRNTSPPDFEAMKCADCGQEILQAHPELCPYCKSKNLISEEDTSKLAQEANQMAKGGRFEEAALSFEKLEMWKEAKDCRLQARKKHKDLTKPLTGKIGSVSVICPHCGASQAVNLKSPEETCNRCGTTYLIPKEALSLEVFEKQATRPD